MRVIGVTHSDLTRPGVFADAIEGEGHELEMWNIVEREQAPPIHADAAVIVFGGDVKVDSFEQNPWLRTEDAFLRNLLDHRVPTLGVCMGAQLLVQAIGGNVFLAPEPEIGWTAVELGHAAHGDPVVGVLPDRFDAMNWHVDTWRLPGGGRGVNLAHSARYPQAVRAGPCAWGVQFHPEVTGAMMRGLIEREIADEEDRESLWAEIEGGIERWNSIGTALCVAFMRAAEGSIGGVHS